MGEARLREHHEVLIIGAGPAGLTAAVFARNRALDFVVLEGAAAGGQLTSVYPHKPVYNYPGSLGKPAGELAARMVEEVVAAGITIREQTAVQAIELVDSAFRLRTGGSDVFGSAVLIASGLGIFEPRRLGVPGEREAVASGLCYTVADPEDWRGLGVAVIGGGDSAVDNALMLRRHGAQVTLAHRRAELSAQEQSVKELRSHAVEVWLSCTVVSLADDGGSLRVNLQRQGRQVTCAFDRVLVNVGLAARSSFLDSLPVARVNGRVPVDSEMRVSLPGVFACGDAVDYPGKARLIVTAMGEAATAVGSVERYLKMRGKREAAAGVAVDSPAEARRHGR